MEKIFDWMLSHPLVVIIVIVLLLVMLTYNNLNGKKHRIEKSFSTIDVYLQKRFDKMKSLLEQVSQAYDHESDVFKEVSRLRSGITKAMEEGTINSKVAAENDINAFIVRTPSLRTEAYPTLDLGKEMAVFTAKETVISEEELAAARKQYNANVTSFNRAISSFPTMLLAGLLGFGKPYELFKVAEAAKERPTFNSVKEEKLASELKMKEMEREAEVKAKEEEAKLENKDE
jgi:LemA protein